MVQAFGNIKLDKEVERRVFTSLGLLEPEWGLYTYLCKTGPIKAIDISRNLEINRVVVYAYLKNLQKKGLVEATLGAPQKFLAVSPEKMMTLCVEVKKDELREIVRDRVNILSSLQLSDKAMSVIPEEKVAVIQGSSRVFSRAKRMVTECKSEILWMVSIGNSKLSENLQTESLERFTEIASTNPKITIKAISNIYPDKPKLAKIIKKIKNYNLNFEMRQATFENPFLPSRFVIRDKEESFFGLSRWRTNFKNEDVKGLWTNNIPFIETLVLFFDNTWKISDPVY